MDDPWKATEYTLAANQLKSDWKKKQYTWNEEKTESATSKQKMSIREVTNGWFDLAETTSKAVKAVSNLLSMDTAISIPLLPF